MKNLNSERTKMLHTAKQDRLLRLTALFLGVEMLLLSLLPVGSQLAICFGFNGHIGMEAMPFDISVQPNCNVHRCCYVGDDARLDSECPQDCLEESTTRRLTCFSPFKFLFMGLLIILRGNILFQISNQKPLSPFRSYLSKINGLPINSAVFDQPLIFFFVFAFYFYNRCFQWKPIRWWPFFSL